MNRRVEGFREIALEKYSDGSAGLIVEVNAELLVAVILELELLKYDLVERVTFSARRGISLALESDSSLDVSSAKILERRVRCIMIPRDLETITAFLLRYFRDGVAAVNHIDLDLDIDSQEVANLTLVVRAKDARPPLPGDEAKRILGID